VAGWYFLAGVAEQKAAEELEQAAGLAVYHGEVLVGGWGGVVLGPEEVVALADEERPQGTAKDFERLGSKPARLFGGLQDCEIGRVDRCWYTKDCVRSWLPTAKW
jgi:hypothetical protein